MRSRKVLIVLACITLALTVANSVLFACDSFFYSIDDIPRGTFMRSETKNMGTPQERTVSIYRVENSLGTAILCTAKTPSNPEERNIYWQLGVEDVSIEWTEPDRVLFLAENKDDVALNVDKD